MKKIDFGSEKIERIKTAGLIPYAKNSRTHSKSQVSQIAASIKEFGFTNPVLVDKDNGIIAGHGRVLAAQALDMEDVPCIRLGHLTESQKRAYIIADNKLALNAGWDDELLKIELTDLLNENYDALLTGFSQDEIDRLLAPELTEGLTDEDAIGEVPADPKSVIGDIWVMGNHRIACGDSTNAGIVEKLLNGVKPHLMVTDPPYGVEYDASWRNNAVRADGSKVAATRAIGKVDNDHEADWREAWALFPGDVAYVWHAGKFAGLVQQSLEACGLNIRSQIIWAKSKLVISRGDYHWKHEPCWYAVRKGATGHWKGDRKQTTLWEIDKPQKSETGHSTQKPVECMLRPILNNSSAGQAVYEPFSGSGTTIIAAEKSGRHCYAIELNPAYVDLAVKRWQDYTGKKAVHAETGVNFDAS